MGKVIDIRDYIPHHLFEAMCVKCFHRWIAVVPNVIVMKTVECAQCGSGYVIDTGQYVYNKELYEDKPEPGDAA